MADEKSFIIVDENQNNSLFWEMSVKELYSGAKTVVCKTAYEALDVIKKEKFDFFIASWEIKPMSGLIFMQKVREINRFKHTPFLIVSQLLQEEDLALAQEFGIRNYLLKPFDKAKVIDKIKTMAEEEAKLDSMQKNLRRIEDWISDNKVSEALKLIGDCLKKGPHAAKAYTLNGEIWSRTEHLDKSEKAYKQALEYEAEYPSAVNGLGKLYLKMKRYQDAVQQFEILHNKSPKNMERMLNLGNAYLGNGDDKKAEEMFKQVKNLDEENQGANMGLGKVAFERGNMHLASQFFKECGKGDDLASYFNNMGIALVNQNKFDDAVNIYRNAITVLPDRSKAHLLEFNIGLAYRKANRFGEAADAFARSLLELPSYEKAHSAMQNSIFEAKQKSQNYNQKIVQDALQRYKAAHPEEKKEAS